MMHLKKIGRHVLLATLLSSGLSCGTKQFIKSPNNISFENNHRAPREFRAAWVATVANINWPSKPGLNPRQQQEEAIKLLDFLQANGFNAVIFQVRPQADALYDSELEPWSYFLTGEQGTAPKPFYDPLQFWLDAAHERGLELHVWLNPYRAHHSSGGSVTTKSMVRKMPESVVRLENGYWWFDPSLPSTQDHALAVVRDLVRRYDIDGVHFDDYFYPYPSYNKDKDFPDDKSWKTYQQAGGRLDRDDWRRESVNTFIRRVHETIKTEKPHVKFGLSPFGIWRPGYPEGIQGMDQYSTLYADAKLWLNEGWIDYFAPQLYWPIAKLEQSFPLLLGWWQDENTKNRHLWPGISVGRSEDQANQVEIINEILVARGMLRSSPGVIHWSISSLISQPDLAKTLREGVYKRQALVPHSPWLSSTPPPAPKVSEKKRASELHLKWEIPATNRRPQSKEQNSTTVVQNWVVYTLYGDVWHYQILPKNRTEISLPLTHEETKKDLKTYIVTMVDRFGNESL